MIFNRVDRQKDRRAVGQRFPARGVGQIEQGGHDGRRPETQLTLQSAVMEQLQERGVNPSDDTPLNTETPGSAIDRLSIMSLRIYHMQEQLDRDDATEEHKQKVREKLATCYEQHDDLSGSLTQLLADIFAGRKRLKLYRQMKMYNDPTLNPYLYKARHRKAG